MKIVIDNVQLPFDIGCRMLKMKHAECPYPQLAEFWDDIEPYTFKDIAKLQNMEQRRVGILCLGLERLISEVEPELMESETIHKTTTWINSKGVLETVNFDDTYELYRVRGTYFDSGFQRFQRASDVFYLQFKDTSTDRRYLLWVDFSGVWWTNNPQQSYMPNNAQITPIEAIAWSIMTTVPQGNIEKIIRQGDCILVKPIDATIPLLDSPRHLTGIEYMTLLKAES